MGWNTHSRPVLSVATAAHGSLGIMGLQQWHLHCVLPVTTSAGRAELQCGLAAPVAGSSSTLAAWALRDYNSDTPEAVSLKKFSAGQKALTKRHQGVSYLCGGSSSDHAARKTLVAKQPENSMQAGLKLACMTEDVLWLQQASAAEIFSKLRFCWGHRSKPHKFYPTNRCPK